jgi:hypothetical protein
MLLGRPIMVWVIAVLLGTPAVFYVGAHVLVFAGLVAPPPNMRDHFEHLDRMTFAINGAEAIALTVCVAFLLAMKRISVPLFAIYFALELLHTFSGRYLEEGSSPQGQIIAVVTAVIVLGYVWHLRRCNLLR